MIFSPKTAKFIAVAVFILLIIVFLGGVVFIFKDGWGAGVDKLYFYGDKARFFLIAVWDAITSAEAAVLNSTMGKFTGETYSGGFLILGLAALVAAGLFIWKLFSSS